MPNLELTSDEALLLKEILQSHLGDLRMEIAAPIFKVFATSSETMRKPLSASSTIWEKWIRRRSDSILAVKKFRVGTKFLDRNQITSQRETGMTDY